MGVSHNQQGQHTGIFSPIVTFCSELIYSRLQGPMSCRVHYVCIWMLIEPEGPTEFQRHFGRLVLQVDKRMSWIFGPNCKVLQPD